MGNALIQITIGSTAIELTAGPLRVLEVRLAAEERPAGTELVPVQLGLMDRALQWASTKYCEHAARPGFWAK